MKNNLLIVLLALALAVPGPATAQEINFGLKGGVNF